MGIKSLKDMKASSNEATRKLAERIDQQDKGNFQPDERFWNITKSKENGTGYAVIRFLPARPGAEVDELFVRIFSHGFQGPGGWFIHNCPTTLEKNCPVCEANSQLWQTGNDDLRKIASQRKRKLSYIANIYVVEDRDNPQNEGKVFLFRFGKKIFEKIQEAMNPDDEDESPINVFDFWNGANFKLKLTQQAGFNNYDKSKFAAAGPLSDDDDELDTIWNMEHDLSEFIAADQFESYETLQKAFERNLGKPQTTSGETIVEGSDDDDVPFTPNNEGGEDQSAEDYFKQYQSED